MATSFYLTLRSNDSTDSFAFNTNTNWTYNLPSPMKLEGIWQCALVQLLLGDSAHQLDGSKARLLEIYSDILDPSVINSARYRLLRVVPNAENLQEFYQLQYITLKENRTGEKIDRITFNIFGPQRSVVVTAKEDPTLAVLHFRRIL